MTPIRLIATNKVDVIPTTAQHDHLRVVHEAKLPPHPPQRESSTNLQWFGDLMILFPPDGGLCCRRSEHTIRLHRAHVIPVRGAKL